MSEVAAPARDQDRHVIQRKLLVPPVSETVAERPRLEQLITSLVESKRAVVVTATAGSGKTTAVAGAVARVKRPVAWLTVDRSDMAPGRLLTYLEAAIGRQVPEVASVATQALVAGVHHTEAAGLLAEASGPHPIALVIDELERLEDSAEAWSVIEAMLRYLPLGASVVLVSRHDIPTALCTLPAPPAVGVVTDTDVAFTSEEAGLALSRLGSEGIDVDEAVASTSGWVTGVLFEGWRATDSVISQAGETDPLYEYLASQILARIEPALRDFLVTTSVLDEVTAARAEALGIEDAAACLSALRAVHLPVTWLSDGRVMRCHSFFREYLAADLARRGEESLRELRTSLGHLLAAEGNTEEAVEAFLSAGAVADAATSAGQAIERVVERLDLGIAERWIAKLSNVERVEPSPLTLAELMLVIARDEAARGAAIIDRLASTGAHEQLAASSARAAVLMSWCLMHHGRFDDIERLLAVAPPGPAVDAARYALGALVDTGGATKSAPAPPGGPLDALISIADYNRGRLSSLTEPSPSRWLEGVELPWRIAALRARGRTKEALEQYEYAQHAHFRSATIVMLAAPELLMDAGRWSDAEAAIEEGRRTATAIESLAFLGMARVHEAALVLRNGRDSAAALAALDRPESQRAIKSFSHIAELAGTWAGLALLLEGRDEEALSRLNAAVDGMLGGERFLELPRAATWLAEARWRVGDEDGADAAAELALHAARRQGSNHLLLQALAFFPLVVTRRLEAGAPGWDDLGRALLAQGVGLTIELAEPVTLHEFGRRSLLVSNQEVKPRIAKSYELLSYLALHPGREFTREELLEALFDGRRDDSTRAYLRQAIRGLRQTLPEGAISIEGQSVALGSGVVVVSDSTQLQQLLGEAARLQGTERLDATLQALAIYDRGPFLPGPRGGWAETHERRVADEVAEARYQAAVLAFGEGRLDECRRLVAPVVEHDPFREPAWRLQMRVAKALGDEEGMIRAYRSCESALAGIGAEPSETTRRLLARARSET